MDVIAGLPQAKQRRICAGTLDAVAALAPDNLTVHTLALKRSSRLVERLKEYPLPDAQTAEARVARGAETARGAWHAALLYVPAEIYAGEPRKCGLCFAGQECIYNIDMMEDTTSIMPMAREP